MPKRMSGKHQVKPVARCISIENESDLLILSTKLTDYSAAILCIA